jgi:hypothetical protein
MLRSLGRAGCWLSSALPFAVIRAEDNMPLRDVRNVRCQEHEFIALSKR